MESNEPIALHPLWLAYRQHYGNSSATLAAQAKIALTAFLEAQRSYPAAPVASITANWYHLGLSPATITKRLNCLSKMGVLVQGHRPKRTRALKWWLKDDQKAMLLGHKDTPQPMKKWVRWTTITGLRIEENLRLGPKSFEWVDGRPVAVTVPGLKTHSSQATLPLSTEAQDIIAQTYCDAGWDPVFPFEYREVLSMWDRCRTILGTHEEATGTLKSLRRNAARYLHVTQGMPLDMVRQYLRHEDLDTTMEYLRLTGGYGTEEMRKYLR